LTEEVFQLSDKTIVKMERSKIGFKKSGHGIISHGLILYERDLPVFNELVNLWKLRRNNYNVLLKKGGNDGKQKQI
jgi:hypothetical protein